MPSSVPGCSPACEVWELAESKGGNVLSRVGAAWPCGFVPLHAVPARPCPAQLSSGRDAWEQCGGKPGGAIWKDFVRM